MKLEGWEEANWGGNVNNGPDGRNEKLVLAQQTRALHSSNELSRRVLLQRQLKITVAFKYAYQLNLPEKNDGDG